MAWKLTGKPYLKFNGNAQSIPCGWQSDIVKFIPQNGFDEDAQSLHMNPSTEGFAKVHLQPSYERTLQLKDSLKKCISESVV